MMLFLTNAAKVRIFSEIQLFLFSDGGKSAIDSIYIILKLKSSGIDIPAVKRKEYTWDQSSQPHEMVATFTIASSNSTQHSLTITFLTLSLRR